MKKVMCIANILGVKYSTFYLVFLSLVSSYFGKITLDYKNHRLCTVKKNSGKNKMTTSVIYC